MTAGLFLIHMSKTRLKELLLELSYEKKQVTLASGRVSDFYFDGRQTALHPEGAYLIGELFWDKIQSLPFRVEAVGGPTLGADPLVTSVSLISFIKKKPIPAFIIRKEPKKHGKSHGIEGLKNVTAGMQVMILEDVVTTGESSLTAASKAKEAGLKVHGILSIVDRQEGAREAIENAGYYFDCLFTKEDLIS